MTPAARIQATLELLHQIVERRRPADALVSAYFRSRRYIGSKDRAAVSNRLYAVLRHRARLSWWLTKFEISQEPRAWLLAWLTVGEGLPHKAISELCSGGKFGASSLTKSEDIFLRKIQGGTIDHPDMAEDVRCECPIELVDALRKRFGEKFSQELRAMQEPAPLDLRVNSLKATRDQIVAELHKLGFSPHPCTWSPHGIRLFDRPSLSALPMLKKGLVEIQDEGSQLVALAVDAKPGQRVVDFCAGAGGKTLALAASMENKGRIVACDTIAGRLKPSIERFRRAGIHNIETRILTSERDPWVKKHKGTFDRVLTDVPCSGIGTWRRHPDARWQSLGPTLEKLTHIQGEILESASRLVKSGGRLIYATCSLLPQENEEQIERFLKAHTEFTCVPCGLEGQKYLVLTPAQHGTDGFFAAVMENRKVS